MPFKLQNKIWRKVQTSRLRPEREFQDQEISRLERVLLYTPLVKKGKTKKLSRLSQGPYRIVRQTTPVNYEIQHLYKRETDK